MRLTIALTFNVFFMLSALAESGTKEYKISKEWNVDANTAFELVAKNQSFKVEYWDKNIVKIDFVLTTKNEKIDETDFKNGLKVSTEKSGNKFTVSANLDNISSSSIWGWLFNDKKKEDYKINNTIYIPKNCSSLGFNINYCDLKIGEINTPLKVTTNYGSVSIQKNKSRTLIASTYTDIQLGDMGYLKINSSYCDYILNTIDTLYLGSSYGDFKISNCPFIQSLTMNYGNITIQKAGSVKATGSYSDIKINSLSQDINATLTYSDLKINDLTKNFTGAVITGTYTDCSMKINPENPVNFVINDVNGDVNIKNPYVNITKKSETSNVTNLTAKTKSATDASPIIKINSNNSDIIIN